MKKTLTPFVIGALVLIFGGTALAGATTTTSHFSTFTDVIPVSCAGAFTGATVINASGNGISHLTVNDTGSWLTLTFEGQGTITVTPPGATYQGHVQEWFGDENNKQNGVEHATFNFNGTNVLTSASFGMHAAFDVTTNANGSTTVSNFTVDCR